jgi:hypothetical protein
VATQRSTRAIFRSCIVQGQRERITLHFAERVSWPAEVLSRRGYPRANLEDDVRTAADTVRRMVDGTQRERAADIVSRAFGSRGG